MTVSARDQLKNHHGQIRNLGLKAINSDATLVFKGFEHIRLLCKQFPWPVETVGGNIEVPSILGSKMQQAQQFQVTFEGPVTLQETIQGTVDQFLQDLISTGGYFDAKVYEGTPEKYLRAKQINQCFFKADNPDRSWENNAQVLEITGTLYGHYYGETVTGNSDDYR